ncbi:type II toxin-antitoxin system RelB/DinJ family antitoxin [Lactococcus sp.]
MGNMIEKNDRIAIRTNKLLKEKATAVFAKNQVDLSTAINMFLNRAVEEDRIPLDLRTPEQLEAEYQWLGREGKMRQLCITR